MAGIIVGTAAVGMLIGGPTSSLQVAAQDETVSIGSLSLVVGGEGWVEVEALNIGAPGLGVWSIDIVYDPAVASVMECSPLEGVCNAAFANDTIRLVGSSNTGLEGNTVLASITFQCTGEGTSALTVVIQNLADATSDDLQPIDAATENGSIDCSGLTPTPCPPEGCPTPTITPTVSIGSLSLLLGEEGSVELEALNIGAPGLGAWTIDIGYDPAVVSVSACSPQNGSVCDPAFAADTVRVIGASASGLVGDSLLAQISFRCNSEGSSKLSPLFLLHSFVAPDDLQPIDAATQNGSIDCSGLTPTPCPPEGCPTITPTLCAPGVCLETVSIGSLSLNVGKAGSVELEALNVGAPGLRAWTIDITYDQDVVSVVDCAPKQGSVCNPAFTEDTVRVTGYSNAGLEGNTVLASIGFHCNSAGPSALTVVLQVFAGATITGDPQDIDAATENGSITCNSPTPTSTPTATPTDTLTNTPPPTTTPTPTPLRLLGDVDGDGTVGSLDALFVLWLTAGLMPLVPYPDVADVNLDGVIGPLDAALILQFEAGLIDSLAPQ